MRGTSQKKKERKRNILNKIPSYSSILEKGLKNPEPRTKAHNTAFILKTTVEFSQRCIIALKPGVIL